MTAASLILDRVQRPRRDKPGHWMAACPCCQSRKGRPLSITEAGDRVLLHAFCGCSTEAVLGALGLSVTDLFDAPKEHRAEPKPSRVAARDVLAALSTEVMFVALLAADFLDKKQITQSDWARLAKAAARIGAARDHIG